MKQFEQVFLIYNVDGKAVVACVVTVINETKLAANY